MEGWLKWCTTGHGWHTVLIWLQSYICCSIGCFKLTELPCKDQTNGVRFYSKKLRGVSTALVWWWVGKAAGVESICHCSSALIRCWLAWPHVSPTGAREADFVSFSQNANIIYLTVGCMLLSYHMYCIVRLSTAVCGAENRSVHWVPMPKLISTHNVSTSASFVRTTNSHAMGVNSQHQLHSRWVKNTLVYSSSTGEPTCHSA